MQSTDGHISAVVVARCARGCGYVRTIIYSRRPTNLAFVGCTARFMADLFASVRDLTCHHAPHAFLCDYAHGPLLLNGGVGAAERDRPSRRDGTVPGAATVVIPSRFPCPRCAHCCLPCVGLHLGVSTQSTSTKAASRLPWRIQKTVRFLLMDSKETSGKIQRTVAMWLNTVVRTLQKGCKISKRL